MPSGANTPIRPARAFGAPHTTSNSGWPVLDLDLHDLQLVGVRMALGFDDARDAERAELLRRIVDAFHFEPDGRQLRRDLLDRTPWS